MKSGKSVLGETMHCPVCRKELVVWKELRLETLGEHVGDPNGLVCKKPALHCPDGKCPSRLIGCMWDNIEGGLFYAGKYPSQEEKDAVPFIDGNTAPFGSFDRGWQAAKKAEAKVNKQICQFPKWFPGILSGMKIRTDWVYHADDQGKITSRHFGLHWITQEGIIHMWGMRMLIFSLRTDIRNWKELRRNPNDAYARNRLKDTIRRKEWPDAEWWRILSAAFASFLLKHSPSVPPKNVLDKYPAIKVV